MRTVKDVIDALSKLDPALPLLNSSFHYPDRLVEGVSRYGVKFARLIFGTDAPELGHDLPLEERIALQEAHHPGKAPPTE